MNINRNDIFSSTLKWLNLQRLFRLYFTETINIFNKPIPNDSFQILTSNKIVLEVRIGFNFIFVLNLHQIHQFESNRIFLIYSLDLFVHFYIILWPHNMKLI